MKVRTNQFYTDKRLEKIIRFYRGRKVQLPIVDRELDNKIVINPKFTDTMYGL